MEARIREFLDYLLENYAGKHIAIVCHQAPQLAMEVIINNKTWKQAIKTVFDDQIKAGKEILIFGDAVNVKEIVKYYFPHFDKQRIEKNIKVRMLFDESGRKQESLKKIPLAKIRFIKKGCRASVSTNIYADKVSIIIWEDNPKAILIQEPALSISFRSYFEFMWKLARK